MRQRIAYCAGSCAVGNTRAARNRVLTWHQVLQVQLFFLLAFAPEADCRSREEDRRQQAGGHAGPGHDVGPVVRDAGVVTEDLYGKIEMVSKTITFR